MRAHFVKTESQKWLDSYKPSCFSGSFGSYLFAAPVEFYPKRIEELVESSKIAYLKSKIKSRTDHIHFDINNWYPHLKEHTFDTRFIDVLPSEAAALCRLYRVRYCGDKKPLAAAQIATLRAFHRKLSDAIDACMKEWFPKPAHASAEDSEQKSAALKAETGESEGGVFIRFSNRSPKDGHKYNREYKPESALLSDATVDVDLDSSESPPTELDLRIAELTSELEAVYGMDAKASNCRFIAFCHATGGDLMVDGGDDAMELICSSERAFVDLIQVLKAHEFPYRYLSQRKIPPDYVALDSLKSEDDAKSHVSDFDDDGHAFYRPMVKATEATSAASIGAVAAGESLAADSGEEKEAGYDVFDFCPVKLAIRKWHPKVSLHYSSLEFRCFVSNNRMTAISQYNHYVCFPWFCGEENEVFVAFIRDTIVAFWNECVRDTLARANVCDYVVDIALIDSLPTPTPLTAALNESRMAADRWQCVAIEINPFEKTTGAGLYNWGRDEELLKFGRKRAKKDVISDASVDYGVPVSESALKSTFGACALSGDDDCVPIRVHQKAIISENMAQYSVKSFSKYAVEMPWDKVLDVMEAKSEEPTVDKKTSTCIIC